MLTGGPCRVGRVGGTEFRAQDEEGRKEISLMTLRKTGRVQGQPLRENAVIVQQTRKAE